MQSDFKISRPVEFNDLVLTCAGLSSRLLQTILVLIELMLNKGSGHAEWEAGKPESACADNPDHWVLGLLSNKAKAHQLPEWASTVCPGDRKGAFIPWLLPLLIKG